MHPPRSAKYSGFTPSGSRRQEKFTRPSIPDRKREHAAQALQHLLAEVLEKMQQHFRVRGRFENMPARKQFRAQFAVVVNFAIEYDTQRTVFVGHRLFAGGGEIDDLQAPKPQRDARVMPEPRRIRPAMRQALRRARHAGNVLRSQPIPTKHPGESAHAGIVERIWIPQGRGVRDRGRRGSHVRSAEALRFLRVAAVSERSLGKGNTITVKSFSRRDAKTPSRKEFLDESNRHSACIFHFNFFAPPRLRVFA